MGLAARQKPLKCAGCTLLCQIFFFFFLGIFLLFLINFLPFFFSFYFLMQYIADLYIIIICAWWCSISSRSAYFLNFYLNETGMKHTLLYIVDFNY